MKTVSLQLLAAILLLSCNNKTDNQKEKHDTVVNVVDIVSKPTKAVGDSTKKGEQTIAAMFVDFSLGDASHYIFKDNTGKTWDFADCKDKQFSFGIELPAKEATVENQGWSSNKKLQGKWFEITYKYVTQPQYQDGPMAKVPVIITAKMK